MRRGPLRGRGRRAAGRLLSALAAAGLLALLPVGAYEPRWFMKAQHVNPEEAVKAHRDLRARLSTGMQWGTFELTGEPLGQPIGDLARALDAAGEPHDRFVLLKHGETRVIPPAP